MGYILIKLVLMIFPQNLQPFSFTVPEMKEQLKRFHRVSCDTIPLPKRDTVNTLEKYSKSLFPAKFFVYNCLWFPAEATVKAFEEATYYCEILFHFEDEDRKDLQFVVMTDIIACPEGTLMHAFCYTRGEFKVNLMERMYVSIAQKAAKVADPQRPLALFLHFPLEIPRELLIQHVRKIQLGLPLFSKFLEPYEGCIKVEKHKTVVSSKL